MGPEIFVDVSFNQEVAIGIGRYRKDTQRSQAGPEPIHPSSVKFPHKKTIEGPR